MRDDRCAAGTGSPRPEGTGAAGLAQLVEHVICNHGVTGSNPVAGTNEIKWLVQFFGKPIFPEIGSGTIMGRSSGPSRRGLWSIKEKAVVDRDSRIRQVRRTSARGW
jgi:hypothetical protein